MSENNRSGESFLGGIILGTVLGAGLFYFLSSKEEKERFKKNLKEKSKDALDNLTDLVEEIEEKGEEFKKKADQVQDEIKTKIADKSTFSQIEELRDRGRKAVNFFTRHGKSLS